MINNVSLTGRLTKDVELKYTASNKAVTSFTLAVNRQFKNANGEREADFINCTMWGKTAENFANWTKKGLLVGVTGSIMTRNYENQQGQRVYVTEVNCQTFSILEKRDNQDNTQNQGTPNFKSEPFNDKPFDIDDNDLPF